MKTFICDYCGNGFEAYCSRFKNKKNKFCSKKCEGKYWSENRQEKVKLVCPVCKKPIMVKKYRVKRSKNICCSKKCNNILREKTCLRENNPNCKYVYDYNFFKNIDTEEKAYLLGWIASDGHVNNGGIIIKIHNRDINTLEKINGFVNKSQCPVKKLKNNMCKIGFYSKEMVKDVCEHLNILPGKKSGIVDFPRDILGDDIKWAFIRGVFDGDGSVPSPSCTLEQPRCSISSTSKKMIKGIKEFTKIPCYELKGGLEWGGNNAIDFMGKLYDDARYYLDRKRDRYYSWSMWVPALRGTGTNGKCNKLKWAKISKTACPPSKNNASDSGYDLTLVEKIKTCGELEYYTTNLKIKPEFGWYFDLIPRSSMPKTGYCIANDLGVIDRAYTGPVIACLRKFDKSLPDLVLPAKIVQIVPRPIVNFIIEEVDSFEETLRASGGFGSSGA